MCTFPISIYSCSLVTANFELLSVFIIIISPFNILVCRLFSPFFSSSVRFVLCSPFLSVFFLAYSSNISCWVFFLSSIVASSSVLSGLGNVTLEHSLRSVTLLLLESYTLFTGSNTWRALASISWFSTASSSVSSLFSFSFVISIRSLASAVSCSCSNSCLVNLSKMQNFG